MNLERDLEYRVLKVLHPKYPISVMEIVKLTKSGVKRIHYTIEDLKKRCCVKEHNSKYLREYTITNKGCQLKETIQLYDFFKKNDVINKEDISCRLTSLVKRCGFDGLKVKREKK